ncbi:unnamed protein product [Darwinula stevensoni]|uniref:Uncharacterized protein n=1 Tax=Darwinula stevensoni TaxID=69355 RepID=A0A7R8XD97_9CRUS|nr:unnamed protein product [Darwinula stevensoni]CAG0888400.1 unnamed protein product [Darwinula stevensoni]
MDDSNSQTSGRSLYETLGLVENATFDEVKSAFRKLAKQYHPDKNHGDPKSAEKFKEIDLAYKILQKRLSNRDAEGKERLKNGMEVAVMHYTDKMSRLTGGNLIREQDLIDGDKRLRKEAVEVLRRIEVQWPQLLEKYIDELEKLLEAQYEVYAQKRGEGERAAVKMLKNALISAASEYDIQLSRLCQEAEISDEKLMKREKVFYKRAFASFLEEGAHCPYLAKEFKEELKKLLDEKYELRAKRTKEHIESADQTQHSKNEKNGKGNNKDNAQVRTVKKSRKRRAPQPPTQKESTVIPQSTPSPPQTQRSPILRSAEERKEKCRVVYSYDAQESNELTICEGDIVTILNMDDVGWWYGELQGRKGLFPYNYVEIISDSDQVMLSSDYCQIDDNDAPSEDTVLNAHNGDESIPSEGYMKPTLATHKDEWKLPPWMNEIYSSILFKHFARQFNKDNERIEDQMSDYTFMQDGAPAHTAEAIIAFLRKDCADFIEPDC